MNHIELINLIKNNCKTATQEKYIGRLEKKFSIRSKRTLWNTGRFVFQPIGKQTTPTLDRHITLFPDNKI